MLDLSETQHADAKNADLLRQLDQIGCDLTEEPAQAEIPRPTFQAPSADDPDIIIHAPKKTPYDTRREELRKVQAKRDVILAQPELSDDDRRRVALVEIQITRAQERFDKETKRAVDAGWRKRRAIDEWRAGVGREQRNSSRRKKLKPNLDLSGMTDDQKKLHKQDQCSDANWIKRCRGKGMAEAMIAAAYAIRLEVRTVERAEKAEMHDNPNFGMF